MKRGIVSVAAIAALIGTFSVPPARAVVTARVEHGSFADFSGGEFDNVSLDSDGRLQLAPALTNLASPEDPIIWCAVQDGKGNVFFGTGNQGKVYKLTAKGEMSVFFAPNEVMVHALAIDHKGRLYAATSPNGRIYRLDSDGRAEVFCSPGETYVWAMVFGRDGSLFLATGNKGKILRVPPGDSLPAKTETYFETKEANISCLTVDPDGNLLAGTSPHGWLYRIDKAGHGFVLFNSGDTEIKQIAVANDGTIFASTFTGKPGGGGAGGPGGVTNGMPQAEENSSTGDDGPSDGPSVKGPGGASEHEDEDATDSSDGPAMMMGGGPSGGGGGPSKGGIYRIDPAGFHERYWSAPGEAIYSMILLRDGGLLAGTGGKGRIYRVSSRNHWALLQQTGDGAQVAALLQDADEADVYYAATSHPGKLFRLDFALASTGSYTSKVFDARQKSLWGRLHPEGDAPDKTSVAFSTRSGNTDKPETTWSDWSDDAPLVAEIPVSSPSARYLQYRIRFKRDASSPGATPAVRRVRFYYQNDNAAPVITRIRVLAGFGVSKMPIPQMEMPPASVDQLLGGGINAGPGGMMGMKPPMRVNKGPGMCTVVWAASDPNQDKLNYSVAVRGEADKDWTILADRTEDTFLSFDTTGYREGRYVVRVTASDELSNTPDTARTAGETSDPFLVDNTPPSLTVKKQEVERGSARIVVEAVDSASIISSASYSLDGKDEVELRPESLIFDSTNETFVISVRGLGKGSHSLLVRAQDEAKNSSVLKLNFDSE
jgi:sugar lactone lactonase YvrE